MNSNLWKNKTQTICFPWAILGGCFLFYAMVFNEGISSPVFIYSILVVTLFVLFQTLDKPKNYGLFLFPLLGFVLYQGLGIFFATVPKFASTEFSQLLVGLCILLLFLSLDHSIEECICSLLFASSICSFLSVDLISTRVFSSIFEKSTLFFTSHYANTYGLEHGVRINSIFSSPNVFGGLTGIAVLFSLAMVLQREKPLDRCFFLVCLFCNSLGFVLAFSMGGTIMLCVAFFLYLLLEQKHRVALLLLMIETFIVTLASAFVVFLSSFQGIEGFNLIPLASLLLGAVVLCVYHETVGRAIAEKLSGKEKLLPCFVAGLLGMVLVFFAIATQWTGAISLQAGEYLRRSAYLEAGDYTLSVSASETMNLLIESQTREETFQHIDTVLYRGDTTEVAFTVPEDSIVVYFRFHSPDTAVSITEATLSSGETLNLRYILLPGFVSTRLQGLFANENLNQRLVFFGDGMKLFWENPLFGSGMGAFAGNIFRVQEFYYETLYVHNHYIQVLLESGILGLGLLLLFLGMTAVSLWRKRTEPFAVVCFTVLSFSALHALVEFTWSSGAYTVLLYLSFAIFHKLVNKGISLKWLSPSIMGGLFLYAVVLAMNFNASYTLAKSTPETYEETLQTAIKLSPFEKQDYMLSYLLYAIDSGDTDIRARVEAYIPQLQGESSSQSGLYLAEFYFVQGRWEEGVSALKDYVNTRSAHPDTWNTAFAVLFTFQSEMEEAFFAKSITEVYTMAEHWDRDNLGKAVIGAEMEAAVLAIVQP